MAGTVTKGFLKGATVREKGRRVDPDNLGFEGSLEIEAKPVTLGFKKALADPSSFGDWVGAVEGDVQGRLRTVLRDSHQIGDLLLVRFDWIIDADDPDRSFIAHLSGTLDTESGRAVMDGIVGEGYLEGARVHEEGRLVEADPTVLGFEGSIQVDVPPPTSGDGTLELNFQKTQTDPTGVWQGIVTGDQTGGLRTVLVSGVPSSGNPDVLHVVFDWIIEADDPARSLTARLTGTLDHVTGVALMNGTVTEGYLKGAAVHERGQLVDPDASSFEGQIEIAVEPVRIGFAKTLANPQVFGEWHGRVGGDVEGRLTTRLKESQELGDLLLVRFDWIIDADDSTSSLTAELTGTLNTRTGRAIMDGVVGDGYLKGARVHEEGQLVDGEPTILAFEGQIEIGSASSMAFVRGDANGDGRVDIADAIFVVNELFAGGRRSTCQQASDADQDSSLDIADSIFLVNYLFGSGAVPPAPFPQCGAADSDGLGCSSYVSCQR